MAEQEPEEVDESEDSDEDNSSHRSLAAMPIHTKVGDANSPPSANITPGSAYTYWHSTANPRKTSYQGSFNLYTPHHPHHPHRSFSIANAASTTFKSESTSPKITCKLTCKH
jgi:hypothetical protein